MRTVYISRILSVIVVLAAAAGFDAAMRPARAVGVLHCTFTMTNEDFGSIDVLSGNSASTNAMLSIDCSGLSILPSSVYVCVTFPTPMTIAGPSSATLNYQLLGPPPATTPWSNTTAIQVPVSGNILGFTADAMVPVQAMLLGNQQSALPGAYVQTVTATVMYSTLGCALGSIIGSGSFSFQVSATVEKSCSVTATNLSFGATGDLNTVIDAGSQLDVLCTNGTGYSIALDGGLSGAVDPTRRQMTSGTQAIIYGLYQNTARTVPWGSTAGVNVASGTGTSVDQTIQVYGHVPVQPTPAIGTYSDTVVVTVAY